ncbi:precorrin-2 dehydrogenase/sirohydrochlorin ferrochelatase family protein [Natronorarus salvus]|uniref:precorrin-2 dehydrogenase/sirohydrochlorin ferrochelatase family protein n=1 Tax=Natronorarus salvus TaxID=3117733 RepID=UPI002F26DD6A
MIPLLHDLSGATVLVLGGGPVGARKARRFSREARTVVVSPAFCEADFGDAELVRDAPDAEGVYEWIDRLEPALVVCATDSERINEAATAAARERGTLVNRADRSGERESGGVVVPATVREDPVVVAIATGGTAPALSKHLRERLETELEGAGAMAELLSELRTELRETGHPPERRRAAVGAVVESSAVWKALRTGESKRPDVADDVIESALETEGDDG